MATIAAGLGVSGKIPFIASYATFSPGRNYEQIRTTIAYNDSNVKIAGHHAGISVGPDGATHQATEDIAIMRVIPNMKVFVPCDALEARKDSRVREDLGPGLLAFRPREIARDYDGRNAVYARQGASVLDVEKTASGNHRLRSAGL